MNSLRPLARNAKPWTGKGRAWFAIRHSSHQVTPTSNRDDSSVLLLKDQASIQRFVQLLSDTQRTQLLRELRHNDLVDVDAPNHTSRHCVTSGANQTRHLIVGLETDNADSVEPAPESDPSDAITTKQYRQVFLQQALPFVGFGFLDNLIMILAGDYIDATLGVTLGISTMAAAGLGNAISDVAGIGSAWYVESISSKIGIRSPNLNAQQEQQRSVRYTVQSGRVVGIVVGCLIGMFPLLLLPSKKCNVNDSNDSSDDQPEASPSPL
jgi:hypothetical protein